MTILAALSSVGVLAAQLASGQDRPPRVGGPVLFSGKLGSTSVQLLVLTDGREVLAASYRPSADRDADFDLPLAPALLITGTRTGQRFALHEWKARGDERASIVAVASGETLTGTWQERDAPSPTPFVLRRVREPFSGRRAGLTDYGMRLKRPVVDRLHDAVRAERWADAKFEAQLLCVVSFALPTDDGCGWISAVEALAERRAPPAAAGATWNGLMLERDGHTHQAFENYASRCWTTRSACVFMMDLVDRVDPSEQRQALALACKYARLGCDRYWGTNEVALVDAARRADVDAVSRLVAARANTNAGGDGEMLTPLQAAVLARSLPVVKILLAGGADPNRPPATAGTGVGLPLDYAVTNGIGEIALWLLDHGAKANAGHALVDAVMTRRHDVVRKILENGENPDAMPVDGGSALLFAVENGDLELVKMLVDHGADPDFQTKYSDGSPIDLARKRRLSAILRVLLAGRK